MKRLAIIGAERMACNYAENARMMGIESHAFAYEKGAIAKDVVNVFHPISIFEVDEIVKACRELNINGVVATTELTVAIAARVAHELGLNGVDPDVAARLTDKFLNREATKDVDGLSHPWYAKFNSTAEVLASEFRYPIIVKPVSEGGKRGVSVVCNRSELEAALDYAAEESKRGQEVVIEEFLRGGVECSVETLSFHNKHQVIQVTEKISSGPPHCVELGHIQPARISTEERRLIEMVIPRMLSALGYTDGPSHTEIKLQKGKLFLIECNTRPGGDFITYPLTNLSTGYCHLQGAICIAMNDFEFPVASKLSAGYSGVWFVTEKTRSFVPVFEVCDRKSWCYRKNDVGMISDFSHNNCDGINYFIWKADAIPDEILKAMKKLEVAHA